MLERIKEQNKIAFSYHTLIGFFIVLVFSQMMWGAVSWAYEGISPVESFYIYHSVTPLKDSFTVGESPRFVTDAEYFKEINIRWEDTLWCRQGGYLNKYKTQHWPETGYESKTAGFKTLKNTETPSWAYTAESVSLGATECNLRWKAIGRTEHGWTKSYSGQTEWFRVNE